MTHPRQMIASIFFDLNLAKAISLAAKANSKAPGTSTLVIFLGKIACCSIRQSNAAVDKLLVILELYLLLIMHILLCFNSCLI